MRKVSDLLVISNLVYLIVGLIGLQLIGYYAIPILLVSVISTLYHKSGESRYSFWDGVLARVSVFINCLLLWRDYSDPVTISGALILFITGRCYYFYAHKLRSKKYELYHAMWHIVSGSATLLVFIGYAN